MKKEVLNTKDELGKSALHCAIAAGQDHSCVQSTLGLRTDPAGSETLVSLAGNRETLVFVYSVYLCLRRLPLFTVFTVVYGVYLCLRCLPPFAEFTFVFGKYRKQW